MPQVLSELRVRPVERSEEDRYREEMARHHYLGNLNKIGESIWYVAIWQDQWVALLSMSAAALKCGARDRWIGWDFRTQYDRLCLSSSRFGSEYGFSAILVCLSWLSAFQASVITIVQHVFK